MCRLAKSVFKHTNPFSFINAIFLLRFGLPSILTLKWHFQFQPRTQGIFSPRWKSSTWVRRLDIFLVHLVPRAFRPCGVRDWLFDILNYVCFSFFCRMVFKTTWFSFRKKVINSIFCKIICAQTFKYDDF